MNPLSTTVSVVIPAYNVARHIGRAIESVLGQSLRADELIVVDDGSSDQTAEVVKGYGSAVRYIHQDNGGASVARNTGIQAASGEWIAFLDGDDEWLEGYLEKQLALLENNPELVWTTGNFYRCLCGQGGKGVEVAPHKARKFLAGRDYAEDYFTAHQAGVRGWTGTVVVKRQVVLEAGLFRTGQLQANDLDMWWRIAYRWPRIGYLPEPLAVYHMGVPDTLSQGRFDLALFTDLIGRHLELAAKADRLETFRGFAAFMLSGWMRSMLFAKRAADIRRLLERFDDLFTSRYKVRMRLLTAYPSVTAKGCHAISWVVRGLKLRKRVERKPRS
ncbi:MAG: glycosyltransferase family 2 protein [Planctomycetes bacterium]|nr:glycosyltransferase family 2 protein [Planctomycetota bacterium]